MRTAIHSPSAIRTRQYVAERREVGALSREQIDGYEQILAVSTVAEWDAIPCVFRSIVGRAAREEWGRSATGDVQGRDAHLWQRPESGPAAAAAARDVAVPGEPWVAGPVLRAGGSAAAELCPALGRPIVDVE